VISNGARVLLIVLLLPIGVRSVQADPIRGLVVDTERHPLEAVHLMIEGTALHTTSDTAGAFVFEHADLSPGTYSVHLARIGYVPLTVEFTAGPASPEALRIVLIPAPIPMQPLFVVPDRFSIAREAAGREVVVQEDIAALPLLDRDVYRAAQIFPGVVADDYSARFHVRGGEKDEVIVRMDGLDLHAPYHLQDFGGPVSMIDLAVLESVDLLMGGFPAEYGDRLSGVFDMRLRDGRTDRIHGGIGLDLVNMSLFLDGPVADGSWLLSARRGYVDLVMSLMDSEESFSPTYYDLLLKVVQDVSPEDRLTAHILYGKDTNRIDEEDDDNDLRSRYRNALCRGTWQHTFPGTGVAGLILFAGAADHHRTEGYDDVDDRTLSFHGAQGDGLYTDGAHTLKVGGSWAEYTSDYDYFATERIEATSEITLLDTTAVDVAPEGYEATAYVQDEWQISPLLAANLGIHFGYQEYGERRQWSPRVALARRVSEHITARAAWGIYYQPIPIMELEVEEGVSTFGPAEQADHYIVGLEYVPGADRYLKVEAYYKALDHLVGRIVDYGRKTRSVLHPEEGTAYGLEAFFRTRLSDRLRGWLAYAYAEAREEAEGKRYFRSFDQRHSIACNADYEISGGWRFSAVWRYHTGHPYTEEWYIPVDGVWEKQYGPPNGSRYPGYHRMDLRASKEYTFNSWDLELYLQVLNLYGRTNIHEYVYDRKTDPDGQVYFDRSEEHFLPLMPTIGLYATF